MNNLLKRISGLLALAVLTGCAEVQPWERGHLAKPQMALDPTPIHNMLREHNYSSREASAGGISSTGGGCGCN